MSVYRYTEKEQILNDITRALNQAIGEQWMPAIFNLECALENLIRQREMLENANKKAL